MTSPEPDARRFTDSLWRAGLALASLALALATGAEFRELQAAREEGFAWLQRARVNLDAAVIDREPEPDRVRLRTARALIAAELDPAHRAEAPPKRPAREGAAGLEETAAVAAGIFARRPASWEAGYVLGAANYLGWAERQDPRLFTAYRRWEAPLEAAVRLAPARREPRILLAAAYLEVWPALSPRKRESARRLLAGLFRNPEDLVRLLPAWLDRAGSLSEAFSVLPDEPFAWDRAADALNRRGDWRGYGDARRRAGEALLGVLNRDLLRADRLRSDGDLDGARSLYLAVAQRTRAGFRFQGLLERALERCPPGPVDGQTSERLQPLLAQAVDRCLIAECTINPAALKRLSRFVRGQEPQQQALAALFTGDLPGAALFERRAHGLGTEPWAPYLVAKARLLASRGRPEEAGEALALVHPSWQERPLYWLARLEVARAAADSQAAGEARRRLAALARSTWPAAAWQAQGTGARLEIFAGAPAAGLVVHVEQVNPGGAVLDLRLDDADAGVFPVPPGPAPPSLQLAVPLTAGLHVLEIADTRQVVPGAVDLR